MSQFEYKVVPAPTRGEKSRGAKTGADRFAFALSQLMNSLARDGWEYLRADTLPSEERTGFTGRTTVYHNILVFQRRLADAVSPELVVSRPALTVDAPLGSAPRIAAVDTGPAPRPGTQPPTDDPNRAVDEDEHARVSPLRAG